MALMSTLRPGCGHTPIAAGPVDAVHGMVSHRVLKGRSVNLEDVDDAAERLSVVHFCG